MPTRQQIGKAGELLVQQKLLLLGIESAPLTTDSGIDLVTFSNQKEEAITIQVKSNFAPKPAGGKGKSALDWWIPEDTPAKLIALVDLSSSRVWVFALSEISEYAQHHSSGRYHLYMYVDPVVSRRESDKRKFDFEFGEFLLENRAHLLF